MDERVNAQSIGGSWSGVAQAAENMLRLTAHGQMIHHTGEFTSQAGTGQRVMIYDAKIASDQNGLYLQRGSATKVIVLPDGESPQEIKEICAGLGCMSLAAHFMGMTCLAALDHNDFMCQTLRSNGATNVIQGDVQLPADRCLLHETPYVSRCWTLAGFPCQPLSTQGDGRGSADPRSQAFYGITKTAWEQQSYGLMLECVPGAQHAMFVQDELQKLAWSLGKSLHQQVMQLDRAWCSKRTRWWALIVPQEYQFDMLDLPSMDFLSTVAAVFPTWPVWDRNIEEELRLTEHEKQMYFNKELGRDLRHLQQDDTAPCILHSYGSALGNCPCGCRGPFSYTRLFRDGLRGFFVWSTQLQDYRFLHPAEAAMLCSVPPTTLFPQPARAGLCLVGQCAAPLQAIWTLGLFQEAAGSLQFGSPQLALQAYQSFLFKTAYGFFQTDLNKFNVTLQDGEEHKLITVQPPQTVGDLCEAEKKLLPPGYSVKLCDAQGPLPESTWVKPEPLTGHYQLVTSAKRQRKDTPTDPITVDILHLHDGAAQRSTSNLLPGTFVFEFIRDFGIAQSSTLLSLDGHTMALDQRIWYDCTIVIVDTHSANGTELSPLPVGGLHDQHMDYMATKLINLHMSSSCYWIPAKIATTWFLLRDEVPSLNLWAPAMLHGRTFMSIATGRHWILLECKVQTTLLHIQYWDGQEHHHADDVCSFARFLCNLLGLQTFCVTRERKIDQLGCQTCGTVALLHLGLTLDLWTPDQHPDEFKLHIHLKQKFPQYVGFTADGKPTTSDDKEVLWNLRDLLKSHGVPDQRTEERARLAIDRIGLSAVRNALNSKNPWQQMKFLGSQPKVNMLLVQPDELEAQIKLRATKFRVQASDKRSKDKKTPISDLDIDPTQLTMIDGTFVYSNDPELAVRQLPMSEVAAHKAGLAFGRIADVLPFLKEGGTITLNALTVLTTTRIPPEMQGLLPVTNIRYPALYQPTQQPILVDGSMVQLGDLNIVRREANNVIPTAPLATGVLRLSMYRDESTQDWEAFTKSPVRLLMQQYPLLSVCQGQRCGGRCPKFHPPVDVDMDSVILDIWARSWWTNRGKKASPLEADMFQVLLRVPSILLVPLQRLSGEDGLYVEPRMTEGKGVDNTTAVIWLPQCTLTEAQHKLKVTEKAIAVVRFHQRLGIRVPIKEAAEAQAQLNPDVPYAHFEVTKVYELRPLPHGAQKTGIFAMLKSWNWQAKPLQPCKSDANGMGWLVGSASDPPGPIMQTNAGDVMVSLRKTQDMAAPQTTSVSLGKTQAFLRRQHKSGADSSALRPPPGLTAPVSSDPWLQNDPWKHWGQSRSSEDVAMQPVATKSMTDQMEAKVQQHVLDSVTAATETRFQRLESDLVEIKNQQGKFDSWFHEAGAANERLQQQVSGLAQQVATNQQDMTGLSGQLQQQQHQIGSLSNDVQKGFSQLEALLSKRQRHEEH